MFRVRSTSLEWALKHVMRYYSIVFFPAPFEFNAISHQWTSVKAHLRALNLDDYTPRTPITLLAPKPNGTFRVVHQLDPIGALPYTALVFEISEVVEAYRVPPTAQIACSYRIAPDVNGSFFVKDNDWETYTSRTQALCEKYPPGFVITCDFVDFYNQIYTHRIRNLIEEAGGTSFEHHGRVIEAFLMALNTETSRGIPVGPAPSIVLSELLLTFETRLLSRGEKLIALGLKGTKMDWMFWDLGKSGRFFIPLVSFRVTKPFIGYGSRRRAAI
jgi:hypothetical protein